MASPGAPRLSYDCAPAPVGAAAPPAALPRPGGVTFACVLSIVLGGLAVATGLVLIAFGSAFAAAIPFFGAFGALAMFIGLVVGAVGALGIAAGVAGLRGEAWARWTMVALFGLGALQGVASFPAGLALLALDGAAIWFLVNAEATAWFASRATRTLTPL